MTQWIDEVPACCTLGIGAGGGTALAQILFGEVSPSGSCPLV